MARILFVVWLVLFVGAFVIFALTPSNDFGFTAGANRVAVFFSWQIAAGLVGVVVWGMGRKLISDTLWRWLYRLPVVIAALLFFLVALLIVVTLFWKFPPQENTETEPRPTTSLPTEIIPENHQ